jgi:uncharacterized oxidoreductase
MNISGNTILITGGGSGIGRALAEAFQKLGNNVIIAGRRKQVLDQTVAANPGMKSAVLDIESSDGIRAFAETIEKEYPSLNVVIHNAGIMRPENLLEQSNDLSTVDATLTTNLLGPIRLTSALLPVLRRQPKGDDHDGLLGTGVYPAGFDADLLRHEGCDSFLQSIAALSVEVHQH